MVGTLDDQVRRLKQEQAMREMTEFDRKIVGAKAVRLEIPLTDRYTLRKVADLIRGFATQVDFVARREDLADRTVLLETQSHAREFNHRVREIYGLSKFNKNGTVKVNGG